METCGARHETYASEPGEDAEELPDDDDGGYGTESSYACVDSLGGEDWFRLGDRDLGLHLVRTQALRGGEPLSSVTARIARSLGVAAAILPAIDDRLRTWIDTPAGSQGVMPYLPLPELKNAGRPAAPAPAQPAAPAPTVGTKR